MTLTRMSALVVLLFLGLAAHGPATTAGTETQPATRPASMPTVAAKPILCPVTGKPIDRRLTEHFRTKWVYFATVEAVEKFKKDPYEFVEGVLAQWEADKPLRVQVRCPVTGKPIDSGIYAGQGLEAIYFASDDARQKWLQNRKPFADKLADCYTFQTGCGLCGGDISPAVLRDIDGHTVYFCCVGCVDGFAKNKAENLKRVDEEIKAHEAAWAQPK